MGPYGLSGRVTIGIFVLFTVATLLSQEARRKKYDFKRYGECFLQLGLSLILFPMRT